MRRVGICARIIIHSDAGIGEIVLVLGCAACLLRRWATSPSRGGAYKEMRGSSQMGEELRHRKVCLQTRKATGKADHWHKGKMRTESHVRRINLRILYASNVQTARYHIYKLCPIAARSQTPCSALLISSKYQCLAFDQRLLKGITREPLRGRKLSLISQAMADKLPNVLCKRGL